MTTESSAWSMNQSGKEFSGGVEVARPQITSDRGLIGQGGDDPQATATGCARADVGGKHAGEEYCQLLKQFYGREKEIARSTSNHQTRANISAFFDSNSVSVSTPAAWSLPSRSSCSMGSVGCSETSFEDPLLDFADSI